MKNQDNVEILELFCADINGVPPFSFILDYARCLVVWKGVLDE